MIRIDTSLDQTTLRATVSSPTSNAFFQSHTYSVGGGRVYLPVTGGFDWYPTNFENLTTPTRINSPLYSAIYGGNALHWGSTKVGDYIYFKTTTNVYALADTIGPSSSYNHSLIHKINTVTNTLEQEYLIRTPN